jgi:hypothetical protein
VLRAIELAHDTGQLHLRTQASAEAPALCIRRHGNFRLILTQNPAAGAFRGKREKLSQELLSRCTLVNYAELPEAEWQQARTC